MKTQLPDFIQSPPFGLFHSPITIAISKMQDQEVRRVAKACIECKKKHCRCGLVRPCERCKTLNLECRDAEPEKRAPRKETSQIIFVNMNDSDSKKRKKLEPDIIQEDDKYDFKLEVGMDCPSYTSGRFVCTNFPRIATCSATLRIKLGYTAEEIQSLSLQDIIDTDSLAACMYVLDSEIKERRELIKWGSQEKLNCEIHAHGRLLVKDKYGNIYEMVKECVRLYKIEEPANLEAIVFYLFWNEVE